MLILQRVAQIARMIGSMWKREIKDKEGKKSR